MKNYYKFILLIIALLTICFSDLVKSGAYDGLLLWFNTILPTIFPFIIISNMLVNVYGNSMKSPLFLAGGLGLLCGFPVCANISSTLLNQKKITKNEAQLLINTCNTSSPMFVMSYLIHHSLAGWNSYKCILIIYIPIVINIIINSLIYKPEIRTLKSSYDEKNVKETLFEIFDTSLTNAGITILKLCGYIIVFSILSAIINNLEFKSTIIKASILGFMEITNSINYINILSLTNIQKALLLTTINNWGGLCTALQTQAVISNCGLSIKKYIMSKIALTVITFITAVIIL